MLDPQNGKKKTTFINPADLHSFRLEATLVNSASGMDAKSVEDGFVEVLELDEKSVSLDAPGQLCALNHHARVTLKSSDGRVDFTATGRVSSLEPTPPGRVRITLSLLQYDKRTWNELRALLAARQVKVNQVLHRMKGG